MANQFIGSLVNVGIAKESSRGAGATPTYWMPHTEISFDDKADKVTSNEAIGLIEDTAEAYVTKKYGSGDISGEIRDKSFGLLLYAALGAVSSQNTDGAAYTHTFTISQTNNHQSLALTVYDPNQAVMFKLSMLDSLEISAKTGEIIGYKGSFMSKKSVDTTATVAITAENKFISTHSRVKIAANLSSLGAASELRIKSASISFNKNLMSDFLIGTLDVDDIFNQEIMVEGELELDLKDDTYKDYMLNNTYKALRLEFINNDTTIGGSSNPTLQINMPRVHFFDWNSDRPKEEITTQKVKFKALHDFSGSNASVSSVVLINTVTSY